MRTMNTMKLAVSVYALTLALATSNAVAAVGMASPSCDANIFTTKYMFDVSNCPGYATVSNSTSIKQTWGETFVMLDKSMYGSACLGYELKGWGSGPMAANVLYDSGKEYKNTLVADGGIWNTTPEPDGTTEWILSPTWEATTSTINLNANNANVAGSTAVYRKGTDLYPNTDYNSVMTVGNTSIDVPKKYGYAFKGYYRTSDRATAVGNFWNTGADEYTEDYCKDTARLPQIVWAQATTDAVDKCPWLVSNGEIGNNYVGTAAAKLGTTDLYAAWEPRTFSVSFDKGGVMTSGWCENYDAATGECSYTNSEGETYYYPANAAISNMPNAMNGCRWEQGNCTLDSGDIPTIQGGMYAFTKYAIVYGDSLDEQELGWIYKSDLEKGTVDLTKKLSEAAQSVWNHADANGGVLKFKLVAKWAKNNTTMNFYASKTDTEPFARYKMVANEGEVQLYREVYDTDGTLSYEEVSLTLGTAPTMDTMSDAGVTMPDNAILRGFVIADSKANVPNMVAVDTGDVTYKTAEGNPFLISNYLGVWNGALNQDNGMIMSEAIMDKRAGGAGVQNYVNVYGVWAQKCDEADTLAAHNVATCTEYPGNFGSVSYVITCVSGYNIDGKEKINN